MPRHPASDDGVLSPAARFGLGRRSLLRCPAITFRRVISSSKPYATLPFLRVMSRNVRRLAAILTAVPLLAFGEADSTSTSESGKDQITLKAFRVMVTGKVIAMFVN